MLSRNHAYVVAVRLGGTGLRGVFRDDFFIKLFYYIIPFFLLLLYLLYYCFLKLYNNNKIIK